LLYKQNQYTPVSIYLYISDLFTFLVPCSGGITHVNPQDKSEFTVNFKVRYFCFQKGSVVDRHRVDADPDPTFHFYADPDPDWHQNNADPNADPNPSFHKS
jgi:hypothetical protein